MNRRPTWTPFAVAIVAAFVLGPGLVDASHFGPADINAHHLNVLVYHPLPDEQGDPWGVAAMTINGTQVDWMAGYYGGFDFPTAVFDGVEMLEGLPTQEGAGAFQDTYDAYNETFNARLAEDTPVSIALDSEAVASSLSIVARVRSLGVLDAEGLVLRFVLYEDDLRFSGGNGIVNHRFVVRAMETQPLDLGSGEQVLSTIFSLAGLSDEDNVGVVALVQNTDEDSPLFANKEVLQSATWNARDGGSTQVARGVLLEMYSATWCASCLYGDAASDHLANEFGVQTSVVSAAGFEYLRPPPLAKIGIALVLGAGLVVWLGRRGRPEAYA